MNSKIALSIDIEDWYQTPLITGSSFSKYEDVNDFFFHWEGKYDYITVATLEVLSILDRYETRATFFVVADVVDRYPKIVEALKKSKHEIGCHGLRHHCGINSKTKAISHTKDKWKNDLRLAKSILEKTFRKRVYGYRAPGAYFATWMVPILEELGFKYDSSIAFNSFYNKTNVKLKNIPSSPYWLNKNDLSNNTSDSKILEIPWSNLKLFNLFLPGGGSFFFRVFGLTYFKILIKKNLKHGNTMFYFHPLDIVDEKFPLSNFRNRPFYWINKGKKTLKRIERLFECFNDLFLPCYDIYKRHSENFIE